MFETQRKLFSTYWSANTKWKKRSNMTMINNGESLVDKRPCFSSFLQKAHDVDNVINDLLRSHKNRASLKKVPKFSKSWRRFGEGGDASAHGKRSPVSSAPSALSDHASKCSQKMSVWGRRDTRRGEEEETRNLRDYLTHTRHTQETQRHTNATKRIGSCKNYKRTTTWFFR